MIGELSEKYYTPEQRASLEQRARDVGEDRMRDAQTEWAELIAAVREQMQRGADPASETMSSLARRWKALIEEFTGGDAGIRKSLGNMWSSEAGLHKMTGLDADVMQYAGKAIAALKTET